MKNEEFDFSQPRIRLIDQIERKFLSGRKEIERQWDFVRDYFISELEANDPEYHSGFVGVIYKDDREKRIIEQIVEIIDPVDFPEYELTEEQFSKIENLAKEFFRINNNAEIYNIDKED